MTVVVRGEPAPPNREKPPKRRGTRVNAPRYAWERDRRGLRDMDVSRATGINQGTLIRLQDGLLVDIETVRAIARYFDETPVDPAIDRLLERPDGVPPEEPRKSRARGPQS